MAPASTSTNLKSNENLNNRTNSSQSQQNNNGNEDEHISNNVLESEASSKLKNASQTFNFAKLISNKTSQASITKEIDNDYVLKKIRFSLRRAIKKENHIKILQFHLENNTVPSQLFYRCWPEVFLPDDVVFVDKYNERIKEFATTILNDIINHLKTQIDSLNTNMATYLTFLEDLENLNDIIADIQVQELHYATKEFEIASEKALNTVLRPFIVKNKNKNKQENNDQNTNNFQNKTMYSNSRNQSNRNQIHKQNNKRRGRNQFESNNKPHRGRSVSIKEKNKQHTRNKSNSHSRSFNRSNSRSKQRSSSRNKHRSNSRNVRHQSSSKSRNQPENTAKPSFSSIVKRNTNNNQSYRYHNNSIDNSLRNVNNKSNDFIQYINHRDYYQNQHFKRNNNDQNQHFKKNNNDHHFNNKQYTKRNFNSHSSRTSFRPVNSSSNLRC